MKRIWICGSSGMLGSHFKRLLQERQIPFIATTREEIDITQRDLVCDFVRTQKISHILNCAAYTKVDMAESEQKMAYLINAIGPHNLGVAGRRHETRVIHFSSDYVFDGKGHSPYTEDSLCAPIGAYGASKFAGEIKLLDEYSNACVIRTSWLFGWPGNNFVKTMLKLMQEKESLRVVSDQRGRPTYCQDLAEATLDLLDEKGIFHFANSFESTWHQFAIEIQRQAHELGYPIVTKQIQPITTNEYPTPARRPAYSTLNTKKVERSLGRLLRPWQEALKDYLITTKTK